MFVKIFSFVDLLRIQKKVVRIITAIMINEKIPRDNLVSVHVLVQLIEYFFHRCDIFASISGKISSDDRSLTNFDLPFFRGVMNRIIHKSHRSENPSK